MTMKSSSITSKVMGNRWAPSVGRWLRLGGNKVTDSRTGFESCPKCHSKNALGKAVMPSEAQFPFLNNSTYGSYLSGLLGTLNATAHVDLTLSMLKRESEQQKLSLACLLILLWLFTRLGHKYRAGTWSCDLSPGLCKDMTALRGDHESYSWSSRPRVC